MNISTDYAIRMVLRLAQNNGVTPASRLSAAVGVSPRYLLQIGAKLRDAGFITVTHGPSGGYALRQAPGSISLYDIILAMENPPERVTRREEEFRALEQALDYADRIQRSLWKSITIESLLNHSPEDWFLFSCFPDQKAK